MSVFRFVSSQDAKTAAAAEAYVSWDTGGQVVPVPGETVEVSNGWRVSCFSMDGRASLPLHVIQNLAVIGRDADGNVLEERPQFESVGPDPQDQKLDPESEEPLSDIQKYNRDMRKMLDDLKPRE
jgi:hypothetical protein